MGGSRGEREIAHKGSRARLGEPAAADVDDPRVAGAAAGEEAVQSLRIAGARVPRVGVAHYEHSVGPSVDEARQLGKVGSPRGDVTGV